MEFNFSIPVDQRLSHSNEEDEMFSLFRRSERSIFCFSICPEDLYFLTFGLQKRYVSVLLLPFLQ